MNIDMVIVIGYFAFLLVVGWMFRSATSSTSDYFRGGGKMLWWMVGSTAFLQALSAMTYDLDVGRDFMNKAGLVTVIFVYAETPQLFHTRNPFASGGVLEDPATGAATAAFAGYLRDIKWPHNGEINIVQGEDMGARSLIRAEFTDKIGDSIRVSGATRLI